MVDNFVGIKYVPTTVTTYVTLSPVVVYYHVPITVMTNVPLSFISVY